MRTLARDFKLLKVPAKQLAMKCQPVTFPLSAETQDDIYYLKACLKKSFNNTIIRPLALAAPQVGITKRFFVIPHNVEQLSKSQRQLTPSMVRRIDCFINPHIEYDDENQVCQMPQICLSVSQDQIMVNRPMKIFARYYDTDGKMHDQWLTGIRARVFQHQFDHLNGLTIDRYLKTSTRVQKNVKQLSNKK